MTCGGIGSIVVSRAQTMGTAIAGFCIIGISFGVQPLLHAVVSEILPRKHRAYAQATVNASAGVGAFIALCMGGALLRNNVLNNYRIYLYFTAAIYFVAAAGIAALYNPPKREEEATLTTKQKLARLDWTGYALLIPGLVLFCIALSWSKNPYPWSSSRIISTFVIGILLLIGFCVYEWRFTKVGILDHRIFQGRNFSIALILIFIEGIVFFAANSYFPFEVGLFTGGDLLISGLHFGVTFLVSSAVACLSGWYTTKRLALRTPLIVGVSFLLLFTICMATTTTINPGGGFWAFGVILGIGLGIMLPSIMVLAQLVVPPELIATASALVIATRSLGATVGLAINNALFNTALSTEIPKRVAAAALSLGLPPRSLGQFIGGLVAHDDAILAHTPGVTPQIIGAGAKALISAYGVGFRHAWIASACFTTVAVVGKFTTSNPSPNISLTLIACFFIQDPESQFTAHIDAPAEASVAEKQARLEGHAEVTKNSVVQVEQVP